jgi:hypothetical protein
VTKGGRAMGKRILVMIVYIAIINLLFMMGTAFADDDWMQDVGIGKTQLQTTHVMKRVFSEKGIKGTEQYRPVLIDNELYELLLGDKTLNYRPISIDNKIYELPFLDNYSCGKSSTTNNILDMQKQQLYRLTFYFYLLELKRENDELQKRITELEAKVKK